MLENEDEYQDELRRCTEEEYETILKWSEKHIEIVEDAKRYWTNRFPNQKVIFLESPDMENLLGEVDGGAQSLLIVDRHGYSIAKYFENSISYAWYRFEPWWYEEFVHDWGINIGLNAENILKYLEEKKWEK